MHKLYKVLCCIPFLILGFGVVSGLACEVESKPNVIPALKTRTVQCNCTYDWTFCICSGRRYKIDEPAERESGIPTDG